MAEPYTFIMNFEYDSWNRVQSITYPDGEVVSYHYNLGGLLKSMDGRKDNQTFSYIQEICYNAYELKSLQHDGNGVITYYGYDVMQRLCSLKRQGFGNSILQDIVYSYDFAGNITKIKNNANSLGNLGGPYEANYTYDSLYRLTAATGNVFANQNTNNFSVAMSYLNNGRIHHKSVNAVGEQGGSAKNISYSSDYTYYTGQPNTLKNFGSESFTWDANGNLLTYKWPVNSTTPTLSPVISNPTTTAGGRSTTSTGGKTTGKTNTTTKTSTTRVTTNISSVAKETFQTRYHCWDEENRLQGTKDPSCGTFYQYDASGERTLKLSGQVITQTENGSPVERCLLANPVLYTSPYLVATDAGYTKHYFIETERVASKIGGGNLIRVASTINPNADFSTDSLLSSILLTTLPTEVNTKSIKNEKHILSVGRCLGYKADLTAAPDLLINLYSYDLRYSNQAVSSQQRINFPEGEIYWQHSDHLGSASWITDTVGRPIQHLYYLPYGEDLIDQRASQQYHARYTFTGKEKDEETGYHYFGARLYHSTASVWLSVDPLSDKYPSVSPYVYCANNPVVLKDPDGQEPIDPRTGKEIAMNLYCATVCAIDNNKRNRDVNLYDKADRKVFEREFCKPDGVWEGATSFEPQSCFNKINPEIKNKLTNIVHIDGSPSPPPCDEDWKSAAKSGSYTFADNYWTRSLWLKRRTKSFNIITVTDNVISQIVNMTRTDNGEYDINSVTTFQCEFGPEKSRKTFFGLNTERYRTISVKETIQQYKNGQPYGQPTVKTYESEQIL